ncbi:hypothetical protein HKX48_004545 [Thoreauomyces humboldtii]|nr:hypothetical protein HKX48_004545 [Thoreauomyces humboldtii]
MAMAEPQILLLTTLYVWNLPVDTSRNLAQLLRSKFPACVNVLTEEKDGRARVTFRNPRDLEVALCNFVRDDAVLLCRGRKYFVSVKKEMEAIGVVWVDGQIEERLLGPMAKVKPPWGAVGE